MNYGGWEIHVAPKDDTSVHYVSLDCWCKPEVNEDGTIVHNSTDNRESFERGERKPT